MENPMLAKHPFPHFGLAGNSDRDHQLAIRKLSGKRTWRRGPCFRASGTIAVMTPRPWQEVFFRKIELTDGTRREAVTSSHPLLADTAARRSCWQCE
ncbi:hypothetical protein [Mesorhizobium hawassense]|uniref:hypothetical protein n=1 Tax=Mesorhizobium hawassense TaxID=1209954 RepID=UPI00142E417E|nr:hypothetical protein [Mesorhizobium hawassense]